MYVDDFKLAGPKHLLAKGWALIQRYIDPESPQPAGQLCLHLICAGMITADTEKALINKTAEKEGAVAGKHRQWQESTKAEKEVATGRGKL